MNVIVPDGVPATVFLQAPCTVGEFRAAEVQIDPCVQSCRASVNEVMVPDDHMVEPGCTVRFLASEVHEVQVRQVHNPASSDASMSDRLPSGSRSDDTASGPDEGGHDASDAEQSEPSEEVQAWVQAGCPRVAHVDEFHERRAVMMDGSERKDWLGHQGGASADDELLACLDNVASLVTTDEHVVVIDPLAATSACQHLCYTVILPPRNPKACQDDHSSGAESALVPNRVGYLRWPGAVLHDDQR